MTSEEQAFVKSSRQLAAVLLTSCAAMGHDRNETANLLCAAVGEALAQALGPEQAVERLRDVADLWERSLLAAVH